MCRALGVSKSGRVQQLAGETCARQDMCLHVHASCSPDRNHDEASRGQHTQNLHQNPMPSVRLSLIIIPAVYCV